MQSMKNQKGAYINARLFVPQGVWSLKNVKIKGVEDKIGAFNTMIAAVKQVLEVDLRNFTFFIQEVANLEITMDTVQQGLWKSMGGKVNGNGGGGPDGRVMTRKMSQTTLLGGWGKRLRSKSTASTASSVTTPTSGKDATVDGAYPQAILNLFEHALALGRSSSKPNLTVDAKFETLEPEEMPIKTQLRLDASRRRIAEFFANIICHFVLQDLATLLSKWIKRANEYVMS